MEDFFISLIIFYFLFLEMPSIYFANILFHLLRFV